MKKRLLVRVLIGVGSLAVAVIAFFYMVLYLAEKSYYNDKCYKYTVYR